MLPDLQLTGTRACADGLEYDYIICKDFRGTEHFIKHPVKVLKTRLRFKLLTLLRGDCDPNLLGYEKVG